MVATSDAPPDAMPRADTPPGAVWEGLAALELMDSGSALAADLAAIAARAHLTSEDEAVRTARLAEHAGVWLGVVGTIERLRVLPPRLRPAYLRGARVVWDTAAGALGEARYGAVGARLVRWRAGEPTLCTVKELLWALEQVESVGGVRTAYVGLSALGAVVPPMSRRYGYVVAQSGRPLWTMGQLEPAVVRYDLGLRIGRRTHDRWLRARSMLGAASVQMQRGNYPKARTLLAAVLRLVAHDTPVAFGARHALARCAMEASDFEAAFEHAWPILKSRAASAFMRVEALDLLSLLCRRVGRLRAALRAAQAQLALVEHPRHVIGAVQTALEAALALENWPLVRTYIAQLRSAMQFRVVTISYAEAWVALAQAHVALDDWDEAESCVDSAISIAARFGLHQIRLQADDLQELVQRRGVSAPASGVEPARSIALRESVRGILGHIEELPLARDELLVYA